MKKAPEAKKKGVQKILRLGVVRAGRFVEERLMRKPGDVTLGTSSKATFMVPVEGFPKSFRLFWFRKGKYYLCFTKKMQGKISIGGELFNLGQMADSNLVQRSRGYLFLPLDDKSRGNLRFGDVSFLFQFIEPPKPLPKYRLPASVRGGAFARIDHNMFIALGISVGLHVAFVAFAFWWQGHMITHLTQKVAYNQAFEMLKAEVRTRAKLKPVALKPSENKGKEKGKEEKKAAPVAVKRPKRVAHHGRRSSVKVHKISAAAKKKKMLAMVSSNTVMKYLGTSGKDGIIKAASIGKNGASLDDVNAAFGTKGGIKDAKPGSGMAGYKGGPKMGLPNGASSYAALSRKDVGGNIKTGHVKGTKRGRNDEAKVKMLIRGGHQTQIGGKISEGSVARLFRRKQSAIKTCYERTLKINSKAQGKIKLLIVIGTTGQVQSVRVTQNETGDSQLAACIVSKIRIWHFPRPQGGTVTLMYPILLQKM